MTERDSMTQIYDFSKFCEDIEKLFSENDIFYFKTSGWYTAQHLMYAIEKKEYSPEGYAFCYDGNRYTLVCSPFKIEYFDIFPTICVITEHGEMVRLSEKNSEFFVKIEAIARDNGAEFLNTFLIETNSTDTE